jgi:hypothetical protein
MKHTANRIVVSTILLAFSFFCTLHADTIADWSFETYYQSPSVTSTNSSVLSPDLGPSGSLAWGHHASTNSSFDSAAGNGSNRSFDADHWATNDYFEFQTGTVGYTNVSISFDQYRSGTGPTNWDFEYSTDGSHFTTAMTYSVTNTPGWTTSTYRSAYTFTVDLAPAPELSENLNVFFRLIAKSAPGGTAGASRVDNFAVFGTLAPVPEPSVLVLMGAGSCLLLLARRWTRP